MLTEYSNSRCVEKHCSGAMCQLKSHKLVRTEMKYYHITAHCNTKYVKKFSKLTFLALFGVKARLRVNIRRREDNPAMLSR